MFDLSFAGLPRFLTSLVSTPRPANSDGPPLDQPMAAGLAGGLFGSGVNFTSHRRPYRPLRPLAPRSHLVLVK